MKKISALVLGALLGVSVAYYVKVNPGKLPLVLNPTVVSESSSPDHCEAHEGTEAAAILLTKTLQSPQDPFGDFLPSQNPQQVQAQGQVEDDRRCERPDPKKPEQGAKDPKKIGCKCMRKPPCDPQGYPSENFDSQETRCKKHCKKDKCDCPNPCKT